MAEISRTALFGKLNPLAYKAIEGATVFCKLRGNPYVELQHWLLQILQTQDSDLHRIVKHYGLDALVAGGRPARPRSTGCRAAPRRSPTCRSFVENAVERGWVYGSLMFGDHAGAHRLPGGRHAEDAVPAQRAAVDLASSSSRIKVDDLADNFAAMLRGSPEARSEPAAAAPSAAAPGEASGAMAPAAMGKHEALEALRGRPDRARARGRDRPGGRAATRRSARSSTS